MGSRLYIGQLNDEVRERDLETFFKGYGRIRQILLKNGFGFVEFDDYRDAEDALYELDGKKLLGKRVTIEHAHKSQRRSDTYNNRKPSYRYHSPPKHDRRQGSVRDKYERPARTEFRLIVENLSSGVSWQDLKDYMRQAGEVTYADAHKLRHNEGAVEFASFSDMKNAIDKLDETKLNGRRITLRQDKSRSPHRSRSRSRSTSRSHSRSKNRRDGRSKKRHDGQSKSRSEIRSHSRSGSRPVIYSKWMSASPANRDKSKSPSCSKSKG